MESPLISPFYGRDTQRLSEGSKRPTSHSISFALLIIVSLGGLIVAGIGFGGLGIHQGWWAGTGAISNLSQIHSITMMAVGISSTIFMTGIIVVLKQRLNKIRSLERRLRNDTRAFTVAKYTGSDFANKSKVLSYYLNEMRSAPPKTYLVISSEMNIKGEETYHWIVKDEKGKVRHDTAKSDEKDLSKLNVMTQIKFLTENGYEEVKLIFDVVKYSGQVTSKSVKEKYYTDQLMFASNKTYISFSEDYNIPNNDSEITFYLAKEDSLNIYMIAKNNFKRINEFKEIKVVNPS